MATSIFRETYPAPCYTCARPTDLTYCSIRCCPRCLVAFLDFERTGQPDVFRRNGEEVTVQQFWPPIVLERDDQADATAFAQAFKPWIDESMRKVSAAMKLPAASVRPPATMRPPNTPWPYYLDGC
jgi:hypothetical protein